jgi:hypothetical protein
LFGPIQKWPGKNNFLIPARACNHAVGFAGMETRSKTLEFKWIAADRAAVSETKIGRP